MIVKKNKFIKHFIGNLEKVLIDKLREDLTEMETMLDARFLVTKEAGRLIDNLQKDLSNERNTSETTISRG